MIKLSVNKLDLLRSQDDVSFIDSIRMLILALPTIKPLLHEKIIGKRVIMSNTAAPCWL
jgi:hypothetical protein